MRVSVRSRVSVWWIAGDESGPDWSTAISLTPDATEPALARLDESQRSQTEAEVYGSEFFAEGGAEGWLVSGEAGKEVGIGQRLVVAEVIDLATIGNAYPRVRGVLSPLGPRVLVAIPQDAP